MRTPETLARCDSTTPVLSYSVNRLPVVLIKAIRHTRQCSAAVTLPLSVWQCDRFVQLRITLHAVPDQLLRGPTVGLHSQRSLVGTVGYLFDIYCRNNMVWWRMFTSTKKNSESNIKGAKNEFESKYFNRSSNIRTSFNIPIYNFIRQEPLYFSERLLRRASCVMSRMY